MIPPALDAEVSLREAESLLVDCEEIFADEPHPDDGGDWRILEVRSRISRFLGKD